MGLLIIDDDAELCALLKEFLERESFTVQCIHEGHAGLEAAQHGGHDLSVLDVMLPGMDGFEILKRLRQTSKVPVLMLPARGEDVDRIVGLELGAEDYLPKPFNPRELAARVEAIWRRTGARAASYFLSATDSFLAGPDAPPPMRFTQSPSPRRVLMAGYKRVYRSRPPQRPDQSS